MNRRELIKNIAIISGGLFVGSQFLLTGCKSEDAGNVEFDDKFALLLAEIAETIIPETNTPGAKSADVVGFIKGVFNEIYTEEEQKSFLNAIKMIDKKAKETMGNEFIKLSSEQRQSLLNKVKNPDDKGFLAMYQIILFGYISSEKGLQATFRYTPVPGKFIGDYPHKKGDKMFAGLDL